MTGGVLKARTVLIAATALILVIGILAVGTASSFYALRDRGSCSAYLEEHVLKLLFAIVAGILAARCPPGILRKLALPVYLLSVLAVAATLLFADTPIAPEINGSNRWLDLGIRLLPADFLRFGFVLLASLLISRGTVDIRKISGVAAVAALALVPSIFTILQPDLSGTAFTVLVMLVVLFAGGARFQHLAVLIGALLLVGGSSILIRDDYQLERIQAILKGSEMEQEQNYQPLQARITLGSGGFSGRGLGQSRQKRGFLPEAHTDFILAVIGEEAGFVGTLTVLTLFGILFGAGLFIARGAVSAFDAIAGTGLIAVIFTGVMIHTLVNTGVIPVTGMPLPLVSWGGSSMMVNLVCIGTIAGMAGRAAS